MLFRSVGIVDEKDLKDFMVGMEFDEINGEKICEKYIPGCTKVKGADNTVAEQFKFHIGTSQPVAKYAKDEPKFTRLVEEQFKFHIDTAQLKKNMGHVNPMDVISVTDKWHGVSSIASKILTNRKLSWVEKLLEKFNVKIQDKEYGLIYASRNVVKNKYEITNEHIIEKMKKGELSKDIWQVTAEYLEQFIPAGFTIYYEIVGYMPPGGPTQKGYTYGCEPMKHKIMVYRITSVNAEGKFMELSYGQIKEFCARNGLEPVKEFFYGYAKDVFPDIPYDNVELWSDKFLERMATSFNLEKMCPYNDNKVPAEGVVLRVDTMNEFKAFKFKSYLFNLRESKEMDSGEVDVETAESQGEV